MAYCTPCLDTPHRMAVKSLAAAAIATALLVLCRAAGLQAASPEKPTSPKVWLSDLPEEDVKVGWKNFGKSGHCGFEEMPIILGGICAKHGLGMHPDAHVQYRLAKKYRTYRGTAAMNDTADPGSACPVIFRVLGDGKLLWESKGLHRCRENQPCMIDITGVDILRLEVIYRPNAPGDRSDAHAVWIDPYVLAEAPSTDVLAYFKPGPFKQRETTDLETSHATELLKKGSFDELEAMFAKYRKSDICYGSFPILVHLYEAISTPGDLSDADWTERIAQLMRWKIGRPDSATPLIALGEAYFKFGYQARGDDVASRVTEEGWKLLGERMNKGRPFLEEAIKMKPADPCLFRALMRYESVRETSMEKYRDYFDQGRKLSPRFYPFYTMLAQHLLPRWGGKPGELQDTAANLRAEIGGELGDVVYFLMACEILDDYKDRFFSESGFEYDDLRPGLLAFMRDHNEALDTYNRACYLACMGHDKKVAARLLTRIDPGHCVPAFWGGYGRIDYWKQQFGLLDPPGEELRTIYCRTGWVFSLAFNLHGQLYSGNELALLSRWNVADGTSAGQVETDRPIVHRFVGDASRSKWIASFGWEGIQEPVAIVYSAADDVEPLRLEGHTGGIQNVAISSDGKYCGTAARDDSVRIWKLTDPTHPMVLKHPEWAFDVAFSHDGKTIATSSGQGGIFLWDAKTGKQMGNALVEMKGGPWDRYVRFLPDDKSLVTVSVDGTIRVWDIAARKFAEVRPSGDRIDATDISGDGRWIAVGRQSGGVDVYSVSPLALAHSFSGNQGHCIAVAFSPDGKILASGSIDTTIKLWPMSVVSGLPERSQTK